MATVNILGRKCDALLLAACVALAVFILSMTMSDCKGGCDGKCDKKSGESSCDGGDSGKCGKAPAPAGNIVGADDGTFSELADV